MYVSGNVGKNKGTYCLWSSQAVVALGGEGASAVTLKSEHGQKHTGQTQSYRPWTITAVMQERSVKASFGQAFSEE